MLRRLLTACFVAWMAGAAMAGPFEDGVAAHDRGDFTTALKLWRPLADQGAPEAQLNIGVMYDKGRGVAQDYAEVVKWLRLAAEQGLAIAQYNLGISYLKGEGVPQNYVLAHMWWNLAAAQGDKDAAPNRDLLAKSMTPDQIAEAQRAGSGVEAEGAIAFRRRENIALWQPKESDDRLRNVILRRIPPWWFFGGIVIGPWVLLAWVTATRELCVIPNSAGATPRVTLDGDDRHRQCSAAHCRFRFLVPVSEIAAAIVAPSAGWSRWR